MSDEKEAIAPEKLVDLLRAEKAELQEQLEQVNDNLMAARAVAAAQEVSLQVANRTIERLQRRLTPTAPASADASTTNEKR